MAAEKGNKYAEGNEGGRPTDYSPDYNEQAYKLCLLGATDKDMADFFDVTETTINNWKQEHKEFFESIRAGKTKADLEIAQSLYKSAQDKKIIEQVPFKCKEVYYNNEGKRVEREVVQIVEVEKVVPADFRAQQFWLKNRKSDTWRDKQEVDHTTNGESINQISLGTGKKPPEAS